MKQFTKDPSAKLDYTIDWEDELGSDTIATSTWSVPAGITQESETETTTTTTIWVSGGTLGQRYNLVNSIVTAAGREDQRTVQLLIVEK